MPTGRCYFWLFATFFLSIPVHPVYSRTLVLNDASGEPYTTPQHDGFLDIVVGKAFKAANVDMVLIRNPAERGLRNANQGIDDGELTRIEGIEKTYTNLLRVPEKIIDWDFVVFSKKVDIRTSSWQDLKPYHIGFIRGWKILEANTAGFPYVESVSNSDVLFNMLERDRIDVALFSRWIGLSIVKQKQLSGVHVLEPPLATRAMYIYLHNKHADLIPVIESSLKQIKASGEYDRLFLEKVINSVLQ